MRVERSSPAQTAAAAPLPGVLSRNDIEKYWRDGYIVARGILPAHDVEQLRTACDELCDMAAHMQQDTYRGATYFNLLRACDPFARNLHAVPQIPGMLRRVTYPYFVSQIFDKLRQHPRLLGTMAQLLDANIVQLVNQVNFNPPGIGSGWGWHQDYRFRRQGLTDPRNNFVQSVLAIDPSSASNGGIRVVPRSHLFGPLQLDQAPETASDYFTDADIETPELAPGDAVLFNAYIVHGSTPNRSDSQRRVFINGYARQAACTHGIPVVCNHQRVTTPRAGVMEFEQDLDKLPLAAKY